MLRLFFGLSSVENETSFSSILSPTSREMRVLTDKNKLCTDLKSVCFQLHTPLNVQITATPHSTLQTALPHVWEENFALKVMGFTVCWIGKQML